MRIHTYITFPLNLGLPYDKILFTLEFSGVGFCIKWIAYKLHFHQNSLRDQMVNCELYIIHAVTLKMVISLKKTYQNEKISQQ